MYDIRFANKNETDFIKKLWIDAFGNNRSYYPLFNSILYDNNYTLVLIQDNKIVSMLTLLPTNIVCNNNVSFKSACFYAIATSKNYRGHGYASSLIKFALDYIYKSSFDAAFLCPATGSLFDFYSNLGFSSFFFNNTVSLSCSDIIPTSKNDYCINTINYNEYYNLRNYYLSNSCFVEWNTMQIKYAYKIALFENGNMLKFNIDNKTCLATVQYQDNNTLYVKELLCPNFLFQDCISILNDKFHANNYIVRTPCVSDNCRKSFGMINTKNKNLLSQKDSYYGFAFD